MEPFLDKNPFLGKNPLLDTDPFLDKSLFLDKNPFLYLNPPVDKLPNSGVIKGGGEAPFKPFLYKHHSQPRIHS